VTKRADVKEMLKNVDGNKEALRKLGLSGYLNTDGTVKTEWKKSS